MCVYLFLIFFFPLQKPTKYCMYLVGFADVLLYILVERTAYSIPSVVITVNEQGVLRIDKSFLFFLAVLQLSRATEVNVNDTEGKLCLYANLTIDFSVSYEVAARKVSSAVTSCGWYFSVILHKMLIKLKKRKAPFLSGHHNTVTVGQLKGSTCHHGKRKRGDSLQNN